MYINVNCQIDLLNCNATHITRECNTRCIIVGLTIDFALDKKENRMITK